MTVTAFFVDKFGVTDIIVITVLMYRDFSEDDMHPFFDLFGFTLPAYGLLIAAGIVVGGLVVFFRCKGQGVLVEDALITLAVAGVFGMLGAKILYLVASVPRDRLFEMLRTFDIKALSSTGQVFLGGLFGGVAGGFLGAKIAKADIRKLINAIIPSLPLAHAFGRVGCLLAGCCYGVPYDGVCSVVYHNPISDVPAGVPLFPVQLLEAGINILIFVLLLYMCRKSVRGFRLMFAYAGLYSAARFGLEYLRYDSVRGALWIFSTSQWLSLAMLFASIIVIFVLGRAKRRS